jgi:hypothetical protein
MPTRPSPFSAGRLALLILALVVAAYGASLSSAQDEQTPSRTAAGQLPHRIRLPLVFRPFKVGPPLPPPESHSATPPLDFEAIRLNLHSSGLDLGFVKIGFHVATPCNCAGLGAYLQSLNDAGVPFFIKGVDTTEGLYEAQQIARNSDLPHTLVYRSTTAGQNDGYDYDVPGYGYTLSPVDAALEHWEMSLAKFPAELDPELVWLETVNEVDKNQSEWLGQFALATADLALTDGYKWAVFGWSSGEPEPYHWTSPSMLDFLRLAAQHPDQLAIALHEYSYAVDDIASAYPWLVGRFQKLFDICDFYGIGRPTTLITEWGWQSDQVPTEELALEHIAWASWLYAAYPQVRGAAIWYLGSGYGGIGQKAQKLISPLGEYSRSHYFGVSPGVGDINEALFAPANFEPATWLHAAATGSQSVESEVASPDGSGTRRADRRLR